jgi:hypothetical protein
MREMCINIYNSMCYKNLGESEVFLKEIFQQLKKTLTSRNLKINQNGNIKKTRIQSPL